MAAYPYIPARLQWPRARGSSPQLLVLHSMEAPEKGTTAESCARFFQSKNSTGSAHLCIDNDSIVQSVPYAMKAAGARGSPYKGKTVNDWAVHFEHAGYARQTPAEWADPFSQAMLFWSAIAAAKVCKQYHIPTVALDVTALRQGRVGITTHGTVSKAFNVSGGHTDPGPGFPMDSYVAAVAYWLPHA